MSTRFLTGISGKVVVGSTTMNVTGWTFEFSVDTYEVSHSGSDGYQCFITGIKHGKGSFKANWDTNAVPTATPPTIAPGADLAVKLYIEDAGDYIDCPSVLIVGMPIVSEVKGVTNYTVNFETNGTFTMPS